VAFQRCVHSRDDMVGDDLGGYFNLAVEQVPANHHYRPLGGMLVDRRVVDGCVIDRRSVKPKAELRSSTNGLPWRTNVCTRRKRTCGFQGGSPGLDPSRTLDLFQILSRLTRWRSQWPLRRADGDDVSGEARSVRCQCRATPFLPCNLGLVGCILTS
jgi:hypothetical protein